MRAQTCTPPHPVSYFLVKVKIGVRSLLGGNTKIVTYMVKRCKFEKDLRDLDSSTLPPDSVVSPVVRCPW